MAFDVDVLTLPNFSLGLMIGAAVLAAVGLALFLITSIALESTSEGALIFSILITIAAGLFGAENVVHTEAKNDQVDAISAQIAELPEVDSFVPPEKTRVVLFTEREENSIPNCESGSGPETIILSVLTDEGKSVDGHLTASAPSDGTCTYSLKLQTA